MVTRLSESELPIGGAGLGVDEYLEFLRKEYLADFIRRGGASVKLAVVGSDQVAERFHTGLAAAATAEGYVFAAVDAASVRVHLVDQIFFAVARQVDWGALAASAVRAAYDATAFPVPDAAVLAAATPGQAAPGPSDSLTVDAVATAYDVNPRELYRSVRRQLEQAMLGGAGLAHEFRLAMLRLCQAQLGAGDVDVVERDAVLGWLRGERVPLPALRSALIHARIGRHNARSLLASLARWLPTVGAAGLVVGLDLARMTACRRCSWRWRCRPSWSPTRYGASPPTARCSSASPTRCATGGGPTRTRPWSASTSGWRRSDERSGGGHGSQRRPAGRGAARRGGAAFRRAEPGSGGEPGGGPDRHRGPVRRAPGSGPGRAGGGAAAGRPAHGRRVRLGQEPSARAPDASRLAGRLRGQPGGGQQGDAAA